MEAWRNERFSVLLARVLVSEFRRRGLSEEALLEGTGIDQAALADAHTTISAPTWGALLERAVRLSGDPALGIAIAEHWSDTKLQLLGQLFASCRTLRQAYAMFDRFRPLLGSSVRWELVEEGELSYMYCDPVFYHAQITPIAMEAWLGVLVSFGRKFVYAVSEQNEVWFRHERPAHHAQYARVFPCTLRFAQPRYALVGPREHLDREQLHADATTHESLLTGAERMLQRDHASTLTERIRALLLLEQNLRDVSGKMIAQRLGLGERSMRRLLADERVRLSDLLDEARLRIARKELSKPELSIKEAAYALGYSEASAFFRAFKRWTGQTPLEYQREVQREAESDEGAASGDSP